ncbi:MAG: DNA polymerase III subunit beta, partial [Anaerolineales bacterium]|nr:DNA polymerase III subunit beta [Anaerolineales bacterium]
MTKKTSDTTVLTETVKAALGLVSKALTKSALPILTTIQLRAEGDTLTLTATDLETAISVAVPAKVTKAWAACAPGTTLTDLASAAPGAQIDLIWEEDSATLRFGSQGTKAKLKSLAADEFPKTAAPDSKLMGTVPASELRSALKRVAIAASSDESRPALCAVQLALVNEKVCLTAADGFRLASYHLDHELVFHAKTSLLIPRSAA